MSSRIEHIPGTTHLTQLEIIDAFGKMVNGLLTVKKMDFEEIDFERCSLIDKYRNHTELALYLTYFDHATDYNQLNKEIKTMRIYGIRRKNPGGMTVLPLEEIKRIPILDVCEFKKVKRTGLRTMVSCPLHEDSSPSMLINRNNTFKCFSCNKSGSVIDLISELYGFTFIDAVKHLQAHLKGAKNEIK